MLEVNHDLNTALPEPVNQTVGRSDLYLPIAAEISPVPEESRLVVYNDPKSAGADRFRLVQVRLRSLQAVKRLKTLLITSPLPGDGKSTVALNLATVLSENGKRPVLLLEADVYRPGLVQKLRLKPWPGLTESFKQGQNPMLSARRIDPLGFYLLPAGAAVNDGSSLYQSNFMAQLSATLSASSFAWILIDSPPTTPVADILALRARADATLLVARAGVTPREAIEESTQNLGREHIMGIVLNGVEGLDRVYSKYYGYGKDESQAKPPHSKRAGALGLNRYER